jgi:hypothetical protein
MEISLLALIGIGLAAMFFGYFFGLFEGRGQGYKRRQNEETSLGAQIPPASGQAPLPDNNLLRLSQGAGGAPILHVDGQPVDASNASPGQRRRLIELMVLLRPWVEPAAGPQKPPAPATPSKPPLSFESAPLPPAVSRAQIAPSPAGPVTPVVTPTPLPAPASLSLVQQIDAILQARLVGTSLAGRGIRLAEALHGGAIVFIGTDQYDGVDKVPDPAVQAAIRAAIAEWERSAPR